MWWAFSEGISVTFEDIAGIDNNKSEMFLSREIKIFYTNILCDHSVNHAILSILK